MHLSYLDVSSFTYDVFEDQKAFKETQNFVVS